MISTAERPHIHNLLVAEVSATSGWDPAPLLGPTDWGSIQSEEVREKMTAGAYVENGILGHILDPQQALHVFDGALRSAVKRNAGKFTEMRSQDPLSARSLYESLAVANDAAFLKLFDPREFGRLDISSMLSTRSLRRIKSILQSTDGSNHFVGLQSVISSLKILFPEESDRLSNLKIYNDALAAQIKQPDPADSSWVASLRDAAYLRLIAPDAFLRKGITPIKITPAMVRINNPYQVIKQNAFIRIINAESIAFTDRGIVLTMPDTAPDSQPTAIPQFRKF